MVATRASSGGRGPGQKEGRRGLMAMRCDDGSRGTYFVRPTAADKQSEVRQVSGWGLASQALERYFGSRPVKLKLKQKQKQKQDCKLVSTESDWLTLWCFSFPLCWGSFFLSNNLNLLDSTPLPRVVLLPALVLVLCSVLQKPGANSPLIYLKDVPRISGYPASRDKPHYLIACRPFPRIVLRNLFVKAWLLGYCVLRTCREAGTGSIHRSRLVDHVTLRATGLEVPMYPYNPGSPVPPISCLPLPTATWPVPTHASLGSPLQVQARQSTTPD